MQKRRRMMLIWAAVIVALSGLVVACGEAEPTPVPPTPTPVDVADPAAPADPADPAAPVDPVTPAPPGTFEDEWAALIAAAQAEGELVLALGGADSRHIRDTLQWFSDTYGIKTIASTGSGSANVTRVLAERGRGRYTVDIGFGGTSSTERLREAGALEPVVPLFVDPTIMNRTPETWHLSEKVWWSDVENKYSLAHDLFIDNLEDVWYNTNRISPEEAEAAVTSYWDLADPRWAGEIAMAGFATRGSGQTTRVRVDLALGQDFWEAITRNAAEGNNLLDFSDYRGAAELVARGAVTWGFGSDRELRPMMEAGLPVAPLTDGRVMAEGLSAEVRGTGTVLDRAPNQKAAQFFINWWYSQEGQEIDTSYTRNISPNPSLRADVGQGKVPDWHWERVEQLPGLVAAGTVTIIDQGSQEFLESSERSVMYLQALYDELGIVYTP